MNDEDFEWDEAKSARNETRHGVSFETAEKAFDDPFATGWLDEREDYGEGRHVLLGMVDAHVLYVAYTIRNGTIRIISARGAEPHERRRYHEANI
jgi:uncharacterized DUF497 family protein